MSTTKSQHWEKIAVFGFGVVFISVILWIAVASPDMNENTFTIVRIVIALAAAGIGAFIPGFIDVRIPGILRAGGAMAIFGVVYFYTPPLTNVIDKLPPPPTEDPLLATNNWLSYLDQENYSQAWSASGLSKMFDESAFLLLSHTHRQPLGHIVERQLYSTNGDKRLANGTPGHWRLVVYSSEFQNSSLKETVYLTANGDKWIVDGYWLQPTNAPAITP